MTGHHFLYDWMHIAGGKYELYFFEDVCLSPRKMSAPSLVLCYAEIILSHLTLNKIIIQILRFLVQKRVKIVDLIALDRS